MPTNLVTKEIKRLAKMGKAGRLYLHVEEKPFRESYSDDAIFTLTCATDIEIEGGQDTKKEVFNSIPGKIRNGTTSTKEYRTSLGGKQFPVYTETFRPSGGYWSLYAVDGFGSIMELVPNDASISFEVYLDAGTTEGMMEVGFHGDYLYLVVTRVKRGKEVKTRFLVDVSTGPHNSARFGVKY